MRLPNILRLRSPAREVTWPHPPPPRALPLGSVLLGGTATGLASSLVPGWPPSLAPRCRASEPLAAQNHLVFPLSNSFYLLPLSLSSLFPQALPPPCRPCAPLLLPPGWSTSAHCLGTRAVLPAPAHLAPIPCALFTTWPLKCRHLETPPSPGVPPCGAGTWECPVASPSQVPACAFGDTVSSPHPPMHTCHTHSLLLMGRYSVRAPRPQAFYKVG